MDKVCAVCFEEMDMLTYDDPRESTSTCFKLECKHSYHTKCIIQTLQKTTHECPQCNKHKTPEEILCMEGLISQVFTSVKNDKEMKQLYKENKEAEKDLSAALKNITQEATEFIKQKKEEYGINSKKARHRSSMRRISRKFISICRSRGPLYEGACNNVPVWKVNRF